MEYIPHGFASGYDDAGRVGTYNLWDPSEEQPAKLFWQDPRYEEGQPAWPERFGPAEIEELKKAKGPYAWAGQYQQSPEIRGGSIIKRDWWQDWNLPQFPDNIEYILASLDTAYTEKQQNDASALTIWGVFRDDFKNPKIILMHAWQERMEFPALVQRVIQSCMGDLTTRRPPVDRLLIEAKAAGLSVAQEIRNLIGFNGKFGMQLIDPSKQGDKEARAHSVLHLFSDGMVYAPKSVDWGMQVIDQCGVFPMGSKDDLVDSTTMALRYLRDNGFALLRDEAKFDVEQEFRYRPRSRALYPC